MSHTPRSFGGIEHTSCTSYPEFRAVQENSIFHPCFATSTHSASVGNRNPFDDSINLNPLSSTQCPELSITTSMYWYAVSRFDNLLFALAKRTAS